MPRYPNITCPDCKGHLISLRLGTFIDAPNNFRTMNYTCENCLKKDGKHKIFFVKRERITLKRKTKFEQVARLVRKNLGQFRHLTSHTMVNETQKSIYCMRCKTKLYYDKSASKVDSKEETINMRTYYHFDCIKVNDGTPMFTIIRGDVNGLITVRSIEWVGV